MSNPIVNPYRAGVPAPAAWLAGRQDVVALIDAAWGKPGPRDTLVIVGHRRSGKTSFARALPSVCRLGDDTRVAFLNLQSVDWSEGLSDLCYAIAFALWEADPDRVDEPAPDDYEHHPLATLRRWLARLEHATPPRRYILLLDEYELLDERAPDRDTGDGAALLHALTAPPGLALGLIGLHAPDEWSAGLRDALGQWQVIRVGGLDRQGFAALLRGDEALPLAYTPDALDRAYQLTGGQPFLGHLLGEGLVQRFNQQLTQSVDPPAPTFTATDVDAVVDDPRFYANGYVYFNGIWAQASEAPPGQQAVLKILANHRNGLDQAGWREHSRLDPGAFDAAVEALARHDVVACEQGVCRYRVELLRRWVAFGGWR